MTYEATDAMNIYNLARCLFILVNILVHDLMNVLDIFGCLFIIVNVK